MTYLVGFGFLTVETEDNFIWILQMLLKLLNSKSDMPKVVVIDRDTALMNDVAIVLHETSAILCYFHVGKNVRAKCIIDCIAKPKDVKKDEKEKVAKR